MNDKTKFKSPEEMTDAELANAVKPANVLSEYFRRKSLKRMNRAFLRRLCETYLREPEESDEYGDYKEGVFTFGRFVVETERVGEDKLWRIHVTGDTPVPEHEMWRIRNRFVPDRCAMVRFYEGRAARPDAGEVILMEFPNVDEDESEEGR